MKRCNLIKRFFIGLLLIVVASISANAQEGLYVKKHIPTLRTRQGMQDGYDAECATQRLQAQDIQEPGI